MRKRRMKIILGVQIAFLVSLLVFGLSYSPRPDMASDTVYRSDMRAKEALQRNETLDRAVEAIYEDSIFNRATAAMVKVGAEDILVVATVATPEAPSILAGFALNVAEKDAVPLERPFEQRPELAARYLAELTTLEKAGLEAVAGATFTGLQ